MNEFTERVLKLIDDLKENGKTKSDRRFAISIGMDPTQLSACRKGKREFPDKYLHIISQEFEISEKYLKSGEGDKYEVNDMSTSESNSRYIGDINYPFDPSETPFIDIGDGQFVMVVPLVTEYAYAGYLAGYKDAEYIEELPKHTIVVQKQHRGLYQAFEVIGESMENPDLPRESIFDGSIVTGRQIQQHLWQSKFHTHRWKDFVIVHKDGILIKRIKHHDVKHGVLTLESLNPDYEDRKVHLNDVYQIFNIVNVSQSR